MSSRYPPSDQGDTKYPAKDRSPPRFPDRRSSSTYSSTPQSIRAGDPNYRSFEANAHSQSARDLPREPPRGPKAYVDAPRGGYAPRGRGFSARGDFRDRDFRESRDAPPARGARDHSWPSRAFTDRRGSPPPRGRTRSPQRERNQEPRDFTTRDADRDRPRREIPAEPLRPAGYRGRGSFRGRGRGDWDYAHRARGGHVDDRDTLNVRSRSQDRSWDRIPRDERERDRDQESVRRDDEYRRPWEDRSREFDRYKRDPPFRPDSRNSSATNPSTPISATGPPPNQLSIDRPNHTYRAPNSDSNRRSSGPNSTFPDRGSTQRTDVPPSRPERDRFAQQQPQPPSSPPQAPQVPAFGSISYKTPVIDRGSATTTRASIGGNLPEATLQSTREILRQPPSAPKAQLLGHAPTAPRAEQLVERVSSSDHKSQLERGFGIDISPNGFTPAAPTAHSGLRFPMGDSLAESRPKQQQTQPHGRQTSENVPPRSSANNPNLQVSARATSLQMVHPSRREAIEDPSRQDNAGLLPSKQTHREISIPGQSSPAKVPTGPRAERTAPPTRQGVPPVPRAPSSRHSAPQWGRGQPSLTWVRPGLAQGTPQHAPRGPSIMTTVPTKRDNAGEGKVTTPLPDMDDRDPFDASDTSIKAALDAAKAEGERPEPAPTDARPEVNDHNARGHERKRSATDASSRLEASEAPSTVDAKKAADDASMDLDDDDFEAAERNFNREMQILEAKRPPTPRHHSELLSLLEECDALASAAEDLANGLVSEKSAGAAPTGMSVLGLPSPKAEESEEADLDTTVPSDIHIPAIRNVTPPIESLPFLMSGPPTPFSQIDDDISDVDVQESIRSQVRNQLTAHYAQANDRFEQFKTQFANLYRPWRMKNLDLEEEEKARNDAAPLTTPDDLVPVPGGTMTSISGKSTRPTVKNASDIQMEEALALSKKTAAEEEEKRTQQPVDRGPDFDKEAVVPDMLDEIELRSSLFEDTNNLVSNRFVLRALAFVPPKDDFTAEEHDKFIEHYILNPKRWGIIAELIPGRTYQDCVQHYYLTKGVVAYKEKEKAFLKIRKGRRGPKGPSGRAKSSNLIPLYDGNPEADPTSTAVTETGRPKRTAAPVFGVTGDGEAATPAVTPLRGNTSRVKLDANGEPSAEKPKRRGAAGMKEKGVKRTKAPLLAAAPGPSPQKAEKEAGRGKSREPKVEMEQGAEDLEGAQLLASLQSSQVPNMPVNQQILVENWMNRQPMPMPMNPSMAGPQKPQQQQQVFEPQIQLQEQRTGQSTTSSYWSVPEHTDFQNLLGYFGTNWQAIADTMKTKSVTMVNRSFLFHSPHPSSLKDYSEQVRNYYNRASQKEGGDVFKQVAQLADEKIKRGDDMGPLPAPSLQTKRRNEATPQMPAQRTLAPSVEHAELDNPGAPPTQPSKPVKISSPPVQSSQSRYATIAQAEAAPTPLFSPVSSQSVVSASSRAQQPTQQRVSQLQGPRSGFFSNERNQPILQAQPPVEAQRHGQQQRQVQHDDDALRVHQRETENRAETMRRRQKQEFLEQLEQQHHVRHSEATTPQQLPQHPPQDQEQGHVNVSQHVTISSQTTTASQSFLPSTHPMSSQVRAGPLHRPEFEPRVRISNLPQQPQFDGVKHETATVLRRLDPNAPDRPRQSLMPSPASGRTPLATSPPVEMARPSSISGTASQAPPRPSAAPGKRSNLMSLLNDEPSEPAPPRKRAEDVPSAASKPPQQPPMTLTQSYQPPGQPSQQHAARDQGLDRVIHTSQQQHRPSMSQSNIPQQQHAVQQQVQPREAPSTWAAAAQRLEQQRSNYQSPPVNSPRPQPMYPQPSSRVPFQAIPRGHAPSPSPGPYTHSRASSYTGGPTPHAQQQPTQPQPQQQGPQVQVQAAPNLQPSPYASIQPHQQPQAHQHKLSVGFSQEPTIAQQEQIMRSLTEQRVALHEAMIRDQQQKQQLQQQQQQQQQEAPRRPSDHSTFLRPKEIGYGEPNRHQERLRDYQNNLIRQEQERRHEQARREERLVYTPPVYQNHGYGPPPTQPQPQQQQQQQQQRGQGPGR
ncbi:MAG: hypothetical protein Q9210_002104 [Variospora velana]